MTQPRKVMPVRTVLWTSVITEAGLALQLLSADRLVSASFYSASGTYRSPASLVGSSSSGALASSSLSGARCHPFATDLADRLDGSSSRFVLRQADVLLQVVERRAADLRVGKLLQSLTIGLAGSSARSS